MADQLPEYQLNPQAHATDQYARPEVRKSAAGMQLLQVADALKGFSANMGELGDRRVQAWQQAGQMQADQIAATHQDVYKNQQDLKGAVERGEIPNHSNPWLMVRLKQDVARNEVTTAKSSIYHDLTGSDIFHGDSPQAVSDFIGQKFAALAQGRDSWQIAAMQPTMQQAHSQMMSDWAESRGRERLNEARTATGASVLQKVNDHLDGATVTDPASAEKLPALVGDLQQNYDHLLQVVDKATASKWISDAAFQAARIHRSPDLARVILDGVKGQDGLTLSKLADNKATLETLPREIQELKNADDEAEVRGKQLTGTKERMALMDAAQKRLKPGQTLLDAEFTPEEYRKLSPEGFQDMQRNLAAMSQSVVNNKQARDQIAVDPQLSHLLSGSLDGTIKMPERISLMTAIALKGEPGRQGVESFMRALNFMRDTNYGDTSPDTLYALNKKAESGTLTMDYVHEQLTDGKLDRHTGAEWMQIAGRMEAVGARYNNTVTEITKDLENQVAAPYRDQGLIGGAGNTAYADKMQADQQKAIAAFRSEFYNRLVKSDGWDKLSFNEQWKQMHELADNIARTYHGPDQKTWLKERPEAGNDKGFEAPRPPSQAGPQLGEAATKTPGVVRDPYMTGFDKDTLNSAKGALSFKSDATIRDVMTAWNPRAWFAASSTFTAPNIDLYHPPLPAQDQLDATKPLDKLGLRDVQSLSELRNKTFETYVWDAKQGVTVPKSYSISKGTLPKGFNEIGDGRAIEDREVTLWQGGMAHLVALKPEAEQAKQTIQTITQQYNQTGKITPDQQATLHRSLITAMAFQELRDQVGYAPEEVKQAGDGAWRSMPMFANPADLAARSEQVMKQVGVKDTSKDAFLEAQLRMLKIMREKDSQ